LRGGVRFSARCHRTENGLEFAADGSDKTLLTVIAASKQHVRDREHLLADEVRGLVLSRAFIGRQVLDAHDTRTVPMRARDGASRGRMRTLRRPLDCRDDHVYGELLA
jgi:hypothetical protein